jgi:hypothetical protein
MQIFFVLPSITELRENNTLPFGSWNSCGYDVSARVSVDFTLSKASPCTFLLCHIM